MNQAALSALLLATSLSAPTPASAGAGDDPLLTKVMIDELELRAADGSDVVSLDAEAWIGKDLNKLWFKTEDEYAAGKVDEAELQILYSRAIAPFWDVQAGWRHDFRPEPDRDWLAVGLKGLAPYFFEIDATAFVGESGRTAARFEAEYELLFTQRLILTPQIEVNVHGKDDRAVGIGSGLSDVEIGLRLRYEIRRELAPYIGVNWVKKLGDTANFAQADGEDTDDLQLVIGIRAWF